MYEDLIENCVSHPDGSVDLLGVSMETYEWVQSKLAEENDLLQSMCTPEWLKAKMEELVILSWYPHITYGRPELKEKVLFV